MNKVILLLVLAFPAGAFAQTQSIWFGSYKNVPNTGAARFGPPMGNIGSMLSTETGAYGVMPTGGTVSSAFCIASAAPGGAGKKWDLTFRKGLASQSLVCTIDNAATTGSDTSNSVSLAENDLVAWDAIPSNTPAAANLSWNVKFTSSTAGETVLMGSSAGSSLATTGTQYLSPTDSIAPNANQNRVWFIAPHAMTLKKLHIRLATAPGTGVTRQFRILVNNSAPANDLTVTFVDAETGIHSDNSNTVAVAANDVVSIEASVSGGTAAGSNAAWGLVSAPSTDGDFVITSNSGATNLDTAAVRYLSFGGQSAADATETNVQNYVQNNFTIKGAAVKLSAAPGNSKSFTSELRANAGAASTPFTVAITGAATTIGSTTGTFTPGSGDLLDSVFTPAGTPTASSPSISYTGHIDVAPSGGGCRMMLLGVGC